MDKPNTTTVATRTVLFLCTGNSCRSQMAEALLRHMGDGRFIAVSAGSRPAGYVHPVAIECMAAMQVPLDLEAQTSKSWDEFVSTPIDVVITLCDSAAEEACPAFPGAAIRAHWSLPDPTFHPGTPDERMEFALRVAHRLKSKIAGLIALDWTVTPERLAAQLARLGEI